jgi:hypothetical protein
MMRHTKALTVQRPQRAQLTNFQFKLDAAFITFVGVVNALTGTFWYLDTDGDNNNNQN